MRASTRRRSSIRSPASMSPTALIPAFCWICSPTAAAHGLCSLPTIPTITNEATAAIYLHADALTRESFVSAVRQRDFYAAVSRTSDSPVTDRPGPEVHLLREGDRIRLLCTPARKISFFSNLSWCPDRVLYGDGLTEAVYTVKPQEKYLRAEVTTADGLVAYSNYLTF